MKITNTLGLPEPIVQAITNDPYDKGDCDFSATELIAPPHQKRLQKVHKDDIEVDAASRIWSLFGSAVHGILEQSQSAHYIAERRYIGTYGVGGKFYKVGAKIDVLDESTMTLTDYKTTSVFKFKKDFNGFLQVPKEYVQQLNIQADCIFRETGAVVQKAQIVGILRDWRRSEQLRDPYYPKQMVEVMDIPLWDAESRAHYIEDRILRHLAVVPEPCSSDDMWERPAKWALMKKGQTRAVKLYDEKDEAFEALGAYRAGHEMSVVHRPGVRNRCESYCDVSEFCDAHQKYLSKDDEELPF